MDTETSTPISALRWEELDEDIWVDDAVQGRFPTAKKLTLSAS